MKELIFIGACFVLAVVPVLFVCNKVYEDGVFGRVGLLGISFSSTTFLVEWVWGGVQYYILPQTVMLVSCFAIFICWHLWRFHRRVLTTRKAKQGALERRGTCPG